MSNALSLLLGAGLSDALYVGHSSEDLFFHILFSHYLHVVRETGKNHFLIAGNPDIPFLPKLGCYTKPLPGGVITREILEKSINPRVSLLSLPWADPVSGLIHPMHEIAEFCHSHGILLHVDGSAIIGRIDFRIQDTNPDYFSFDNGIFTRQPLYVAPVPAELVTTLTKQVEYRLSAFDRVVTEVARLRDLLEDKMSPLAELPFKSSERVPDIAAFSLRHMHSDYLRFLLHRRQIVSHAVDDHTVSLRLSPTMDEVHIEQLIKVLKECIHEPA
ncbi:MAG: aminotransferase class V-fold PLP-dependent enzyme [Verrucomicrobia bacterium]|nr:aminotransferase class V-fold PLP-dependent enzyme [Verrucomicrobiota bacterium]